jgi:hypothetical protein
MSDDSVFLRSTEDPDFVDSVALIKLAQRYGISLSERYPAVETRKQLAELRDWVYGEVQKKDPLFVPPPRR